MELTSKVKVLEQSITIKQFRAVLVHGGLDKTTFDGLSSVGAEEESSSKRAETGDDQCLGKGNSTETDGGGERVGNIVGTDTKSITEGHKDTDPEAKSIVTGIHCG